MDEAALASDGTADILKVRRWCLRPTAKPTTGLAPSSLNLSRLAKGSETLDVQADELAEMIAGKAQPPPRQFAESLSGLIERVTFFNDDSGFAVLKVKAKGHRDYVTVVGSLPSVSAGETGDSGGSPGSGPGVRPPVQGRAAEQHLGPLQGGSPLVSNPSHRVQTR